MGVRIQELPATSGIKKEDVLIVEDGQGTKKGTVQQLDELLGVSQLKEDLDKLYKNYNLMDFTENKYNSVLNKSGLSISNKRRNSIAMSTSTEQTLLFTFDVEPNTQYEYYVNYNNTGTVNVRLYVDGDLWAMTGTQKTYTTKATETSLTVRIYLDANSSINISDIDIREKGKTDGLDTDLIKSFLECHQYAKASNNIIQDTWHVGTINGDGTINTSSTTLRYSNPIKINKGLTYFTSGSDGSLASIKFYSTEPDLTASEPVAPIKSYDSCAYFTAEETGYAVIISSATYAGTIYEKYIDENGTISSIGGSSTVKIVQQRDVVNKVERQVVSTTIETVEGSRYASLYGVLPSNTASVNTANMQSLLDNGGTIIVDIAGIYEFNACLKIGSNTTLICYDGVIFKQNNEYGGGIILNKGALTKTYDTNITIDGLKFMYDNHDGSPTNSIRGLRGKISFYYAKNVVIRNVVCTDITPYVFFIHLCCFNNVLIEGCEIRGQKDGIHVSKGDGLTIRRCILGTHDDPIALNAHDHIESCPELGWIRNVLVEDCVNEMSEGVTPGSRGVLILGGAWLDWNSGNLYRRGDSVVGSNGYVYRLYADVRTNTDGTPVEYTSTVEPTHEEGVAEYSDGIKWLCVQHDTLYNAGVENVTFRNYHLNVRHDATFLFDADDTPHSRGAYPNACVMPHKNITFENVTVNPEVQSGVPMFLNLSYPCDFVRIINCAFYGYAVVRNQFKTWDTVNGNNKARLLISGCRFGKSKDVSAMMLALISNDINVVCDASMNYVDEALRISAQSGSFVMKNNDLTTNI